MESQGTQLALNFTEEFSRGGIYGVHYENARAEQQIDMWALQKDMQVQNEVARLIQELTETVSETSVIAFDGAYLVLRLIKKDSLSYGQLYAKMQQLQDKYAIQAYSCKQATLEQIFNSFATQDKLKIFNARVSILRRSLIQS